MQNNKYLQDSNRKEMRQSMMAVFIRVSSWIAIPVVIGAFLGKYLDYKYGTGNIWLLTIVGISFLISMVGIVKETNKEYQRILQKSNNEKIKKKNEHGTNK